MSELDPSGMAEIIRRALDSRINDIHVSLPGQVKSYDSKAQTVDVLPMVTRPMPTESGETVFLPLPIIPDVRVSFPRSKKFSLTFPLEAGDEGMIVFSGWDIAGWLTSGKVCDPIDLRNHHPSHAWFQPGLCSDPNTVKPDPGTEALVLAGSDVRLGAGTASERVALAGPALDYLKAVITAGVATPNDGGANLKATMLAYINLHTSPNPFAATLVKAK